MISNEALVTYPSHAGGRASNVMSTVNGKSNFPSGFINSRVYSPPGNTKSKCELMNHFPACNVYLGNSKDLVGSATEVTTKL